MAALPRRINRTLHQRQMSVRAAARASRPRMSVQVADRSSANSQDPGELAQEIKREFESLKSIRYNWEPYWSDIAYRILPHQNVFLRSMLGVPQAERRTEYIFDSTAPQALEDCAAAFEAMLFPRTQKWHKLVPSDPSLKDNRDVRAYLEDVNDVLFAARYSPKANFASQAHENMLGLVAFGTGSLFVDEKLGEHIRYRAVPLQDLYFAENHVGVIDRVFRAFLFNSVQAAEQWGLENLPASVQAKYKNPSQKFQDIEWLHCVRPRKNPGYGRSDAEGMPLESHYLCLTELKMIESGGYRSMPYATSRYLVGPREVYGRSPSMTNLADIKMVSEMSRTMINSAQLAVAPPVLLPEVGASFSLRPSALNYGMVTDKGEILAHPFISGTKPEFAQEEIQDRRKSIRAGYLGSIFQMLTDHPDMTATQALLIAQERGILITPVMGRQQSEFLGVCISRELDLLAHANQLPPMPPELMRAGGVIKVEYSSPLNLLQRAQDGVGILNTFQQLAPYAEAGHPEVFDVFDPMATARELAEINGVPAKVLRDPQEVADIQQQKAQAANAQTLVQAAPQAAAAAKDLASAHATMAGVNAQQVPPTGTPQ
jgi:hypothetical protein